MRNSGWIERIPNGIQSLLQWTFDGLVPGAEAFQELRGPFIDGLENDPAPLAVDENLATIFESALFG